MRWRPRQKSLSTGEPTVFSSQMTTHASDHADCFMQRGWVFWRSRNFIDITAQCLPLDILETGCKAHRVFPCPASSGAKFARLQPYLHQGMSQGGRLFRVGGPRFGSRFSMSGYRPRFPSGQNTASALRQIISCRRPLGDRHPSHSHTRRDNSRREIDGSARNARRPGMTLITENCKCTRKRLV